MPETVISGWKLDPDQRAELLARIAPVYPHVIANHVTLLAGGTEPPAPPAHAEIVGLVDDGAGVQAAVVAIEGTTDRPDGSTYHITWSLDRAKGREAKESNDVIRRLGWTPLGPLPITLEPALWP